MHVTSVLAISVAIVRTSALPSRQASRQHAASLPDTLLIEPPNSSRTDVHLLACSILFYSVLFHPHHVSLCSYWSALLQKRGVDVIPFDITVTPKNCWSKVRRGGPEVLLDGALRGESYSLRREERYHPNLITSLLAYICCVILL
jgi:hypothetical protein